MATTQTVDPELQKRIDLGKAGKLWRIEVLYKDGHETRRAELRDRTGREVREFRASVYLEGIALPVDPGHWRVVSPYDIIQIDVWKQARYFGNEYL
jgi:hypothetical protein